MNEKIMTILKDLTGSDEVEKNKDVDLFTNGLLDSMGTVQLLLELQSEFDVDVPISEFDRNEWNTPNKIIAKVSDLQA